MKISLIQTGKTKTAYLKEGINEYHRRLKKYGSFKEITIPDLKNTRNLSIEEIKNKEGILSLKHCKPGDFIILLDENGKILSSTELAGYLEKKCNLGRDIVLVIGGAYGFSKEMYKRADDIISLSRLTFSHELVRLILAEQLYRVMTIIKGEPYHHK